MAPSELFAKMAAALDSNRKIRRGGRNAREVYLWVLRQVALRNSDGSIPLEDVADFEHVSEQLMCSENEARDGYKKAIEHRLLTVTDGRCAIVGWDDDWGRRAVPGRERTAKWRANQENLRGDDTLRGVPPVSVTNASSRVTAGDARVTRDAGEERRGEESVPAEVSAGPATGEFRLTGDRGPAKARTVKHALPDEWQPNDSHRALARSIGLDLADQAERMRDWARSNGAKRLDWDGTFRNWLKGEGDKRPRRFNGHSSGPLPEV